MQFYSLTASRTSGTERTCAMFPAMGLDEAARYAEILKDSGHLGYVEFGSLFAVRASSRRETELLQRFMATCNRTETAMHAEQDFDGLLNRRQSLMLTFFMALYLAPEEITKMVNNPAGGITKAAPGGGTGGNTGSGGIETSSAAPTPAETAPTEASAATAAGTDSPAAFDDQDDTILTDDAPIDNSNQDSILADLLGSPEANDGGASRDRDVELGD
jgi:hypothetical protein